MIQFGPFYCCSCNLIKPTIPIYIKKANIFFHYKPGNFQFQYEEQSLIGLSMAYKES